MKYFFLQRISDFKFEIFLSQIFSHLHKIIRGKVPHNVYSKSVVRGIIMGPNFDLYYNWYFDTNQEYKSCYNSFSGSGRVILEPSIISFSNPMKISPPKKKKKNW